MIVTLDEPPKLLNTPGGRVVAGSNPHGHISKWARKLM